MPFLSIVIANYNYGRFLDEAIQSIISQSCQDYELIVVDGGSTDNSVDVIKKYANDLPSNMHALSTSNMNAKIAWWCSEKDGGQSDAFNKGFAHATGQFLTWLNADDVMLPGTIEKLKEAAEKRPEQEWFVGGCFWLDPEMRIVNMGRGRPFSEIRYREGNVCVWGPSSFFSKRLLDAVGGVDVRFHFSMDADLWLRFACRENARYEPFCNYAWGLRLHPDAKMSCHNFTADGVLDIKRSQAEQIATSKYKTRKDQETALRTAYFSARRRTFLSKLISVHWPQVIAAKIDLWRWRGRHYKDYYR